MKKIFAALFLSVASATSAAAADDSFYVGLSLGGARSDTSNPRHPRVTTLQGGYQFNKNLAVEALYGDFGNFSPDQFLKPRGGAVTVMGIVPFNDHWSGFGKLGFSSIDTNVSGYGSIDGTYKKTAVTYGIGGGYNFSPAFALRLGMDIYRVGGAQAGVAIENNTLTVTTIGAIYKF